MKKTYFLLCLYSPCMLYAADMLSMPKAKAPQNNKEVIAQITTINAELTFVPNPSINSVKDNYFDLIQSNANGDVIGGERFKFDNEIIKSGLKKATDSTIYKPMLEKNKVWYYVTYGRRSRESDRFCEIDSIYTNGDTTINGLAYTILNDSYYNTFYIREDTIERKIYKLYKDSSNNYIDTIHINFKPKLKDVYAPGMAYYENDNLNYPYVSTYGADDYYTMDSPEVKLKLNNFNGILFNDYYKYRIYESIGNLAFGPLGVLEFITEFVNIELGLVKVGKDTIYFNEELIKNCNAINNISNKKISPLKIYPNPSNQSTLITLPQPTGTLTVVDALGRVVHSDINVITSTYELNTSTFASGLYQVRYSYVGGTAVGKVMVQR